MACSILRISAGLRIKHPKDVLSENQEIEVKILNVDPDKKKISLGYKQLQPKPWDLAPEKYHAGDVVEGKVVRMAPFGAFVELGAHDRWIGAYFSGFGQTHRKG